MADLKEKSIALLSTTTVSTQSTDAQTLYTVPVGKTCILDSLLFVCGSAASTTAKFTVGASTATTDFLAEVTCTNHAAAGDVLRCVPIPATTPLKGKPYAAGTAIVFKITTADADGATDSTAYLYGTLH